MEQSSGEDQYYWLLATIQAAREDIILKIREEQTGRDARSVRERNVFDTVAKKIF